MSKITELVEKLSLPIIEETDCELWDVEYIKEAGDWYLRIYIDKKDGVSINDCEMISRRIDPLLDEADFIPDSYVFEVCSAGADRILKRKSDFERFISSIVDVKLYKAINGSKKFSGQLLSYDDSGLSIMVNDKPLLISHDALAQVRLHVDF